MVTWQWNNVVYPECVHISTNHTILTFDRYTLSGTCVALDLPSFKKMWGVLSDGAHEHPSWQVWLPSFNHIHILWWNVLNNDLLWNCLFYFSYHLFGTSNITEGYYLLVWLLLAFWINSFTQQGLSRAECGKRLWTFMKKGIIVLNVASLVFYLCQKVIQRIFHLWAQNRT